MNKAPWWLVAVLGAALVAALFDDMHVRGRLEEAVAAREAAAAARPMAEGRMGGKAGKEGKAGLRRGQGAEGVGKGAGARATGSGASPSADATSTADRRTAWREQRQEEARTWVDQYVEESGLDEADEGSLEKVVTTSIASLLELRRQSMEQALPREEADTQMVEARAKLHTDLVELLGEEEAQTFEDSVPPGLGTVLKGGKSRPQLPGGPMRRGGGR